MPQPDVVDEVNGELIWSDLTLWLGDLPAHGSAQITVVFIALAEIDLTTNAVSVSEGQDWYGNEMGAGADQVPITIVDGGTQVTATPAGTPSETATPVAATTTPAAATATPQMPQRLPDTGIPPQSTGNFPGWLALFAALLPVAGWALLRLKRGP